MIPDPGNPTWDLADLNRRVAVLETQARAANTTMRGGSFVLQNEDQEDLFDFGSVTGGDDTAGYGLDLQDSERTLLSIRDDTPGLVYPFGYAPWHNATEFVAVSSGTFTTTYVSRLNVPSHEVVYVCVRVGADVGTTGEIRLHESYSNTAFVTPLAIPDGAAAFCQLAWIHPGTTGWGDKRPGRIDAIEINLQMRVASGGGNVTIWDPGPLELRSSHAVARDIIATTDGAAAFL